MTRPSCSSATTTTTDEDPLDRRCRGRAPGGWLPFACLAPLLHPHQLGAGGPVHAALSGEAARRRDGDAPHLPARRAGDPGGRQRAHLPAPAALVGAAA